MSRLNSIESDIALNHAPARDGGLGIIWFDGTHVGAESLALSEQLKTQLDQIEEDGNTALLVLRHLCVASSTHAHTPLGIDEHRHLEQQIQRMESLPVVSVVWVDGPCAGGPFELAVAADLCFAAVSASFRCPQVGEGHLPGLSVNRLPQLIGARATRRLLLFGETWGAERALTAGLVDGMLDADQFDDYMRDLAARLPQNDGVSLKMCRRLINEAHCTDYETGVGHFIAAQTRCRDATRERF
ncbi:MAG TPA: enoyl-CoA hydratase/isomerase family protein [Luteibacter sp.]|jgi:enoyl-CoA hydratase/carnithine racemase|nr:enoyl-CoA hydratase/isomerase family protein [Luteibacter sp.]